MFLGGSGVCSNYYCVVWFGVNAVVGFWKTNPHGKRGERIVIDMETNPEKFMANSLGDSLN